jgi:hypothetical protein
MGGRVREFINEAFDNESCVRIANRPPPKYWYAELCGVQADHDVGNGIGHFHSAFE